MNIDGGCGSAGGGGDGRREYVLTFVFVVVFVRRRERGEDVEGRGDACGRSIEANTTGDGASGRAGGEKRESGGGRGVRSWCRNC